MSYSSEQGYKMLMNINTSAQKAKCVCEILSEQRGREWC